MIKHNASISAIADTSSALYKGRAFFSARGNETSMTQETWCDRLQAQLAKDGRSMREVSLAAGLSKGYVHGILKDGKDPTIDKLAAVSKALHLSLAYVLVGLKVSPETEQVVQALEGNPERRDAVLRLLGTMKGD